MRIGSTSRSTAPAMTGRHAAAGIGGDHQPRLRLRTPRGARRLGYVASKHAGIGLTQSAALEYASEGIRVNAVAPWLVDTPLIHDDSGELFDSINPLIANHPIGRIAQPEEIADALVWLASPRASYVTGVALPIDGGLTAA